MNYDGFFARLRRHRVHQRPRVRADPGPLGRDDDDGDLGCERGAARCVVQPRAARRARHGASQRRRRGVTRAPSHRSSAGLNVRAGAPPGVRAARRDWP